MGISRIILSLVFVALISSSHAQACTIEDWTWRWEPTIESVIIQGVTTCESGKLILRLYDLDEKGKERFLAVDRSYIEGFTFETYVTMPQPRQDKLRFKYQID